MRSIPEVEVSRSLAAWYEFLRLRDRRRVLASRAEETHYDISCLKLLAVDGRRLLANTEVALGACQSLRLEDILADLLVSRDVILLSETLNISPIRKIVGMKEEFQDFGELWRLSAVMELRGRCSDIPQQPGPPHRRELWPNRFGPLALRFYLPGEVPWRHCDHTSGDFQLPLCLALPLTSWK